MVVNQTLGLNALRQDLNRLFYQAPINQAPFGQALIPQAHLFGQGLYQGINYPMNLWQGHFTPRANLAETQDAVVVCLELCGIEPSQIQLNIHGSVLVLEGVRQPNGLLGNQMITFNVTEGRFGQFRWFCQIPNGTLVNHIEANYRNGLLTIVLPKANAQVGMGSLTAAQATISPVPTAQVVINSAVNA